MAAHNAAETNVPTTTVAPSLNDVEARSVGFQKLCRKMGLHRLDKPAYHIHVCKQGLNIDFYHDMVIVRNR